MRFSRIWLKLKFSTLSIAMVTNFGTSAAALAAEKASASFAPSASKISCSDKLENISAQKSFLDKFDQRLDSSMRSILNLKTGQDLLDAQILDVKILYAKDKYAGKKIYIVSLKENYIPQPKMLWFTEARGPFKTKLLAGYFKASYLDQDEMARLREVAGDALVDETGNVQYQYETKIGYKAVAEKIKMAREQFKKMAADLAQDKSEAGGAVRNMDAAVPATASAAELNVGSQFLKHFGAYALDLAEKDKIDLSRLAGAELVATKTYSKSEVPCYLFRTANYGHPLALFGLIDGKPFAYAEFAETFRPGGPDNEAKAYINRSGDNPKSPVTDREFQLDNGQFMYFEKGSPGERIIFSPPGTLRGIQNALRARDYAADNFEGGDYSYLASNFIDQIMRSGLLRLYDSNSLDHIEILGRGFAFENPEKQFLLIKLDVWRTAYAYIDTRGQAHFGLMPERLLAPHVNGPHAWRLYLKRFNGLKAQAGANENDAIEFFKEFGFRLVLPSKRIISLKTDWRHNELLFSAQGP